MTKEKQETAAKECVLTQIIAAKQTIPPLVKDAKGARNAAYTRYETVVYLLTPSLSEHGLHFYHKLDGSEPGCVSVECIIIHAGSGTSISSGAMKVPSDSMSNAVQGHVSAVSYLKRITLLAVLGLSTPDEDDDGEKAGDVKTITDKQREKISTLAEETSTKISTIESSFKKPMSSFTEGEAGRAIEILEKKRNRQKESVRVT